MKNVSWDYVFLPRAECRWVLEKSFTLQRKSNVRMLMTVCAPCRGLE